MHRTEKALGEDVILGNLDGAKAEIRKFKVKHQKILQCESCCEVAKYDDSLVS